MLTQTVPVTKTGRLILVRLLAPAKRMNPSSLRKGLDSFFRGRPAGEWKALFADTLAALERDGLLTCKPLALTDAGRAEALDFLGLTELPPRVDWRKLKSGFLIPATFAGTADAARREQMGTADGLRLALLRMRHDSPDAGTLSQALDGVICKELELEPKGRLTLGVLKARLLSRILNVVGNPPLKAFQKLAPAQAVGASRTGADDLRSALLREWLKDEETAAPPATEACYVAPPAERPAAPFDLAAFAARVLGAARASETGRFGDNKVFISHVWRGLSADPPHAGVSRDEFNRQLCEANRQRLINLSRADLVEAMDPDDVRDSEVRDHGATYHFIRI